MGKKHKRKLTIRVTPQTAFNLEKLAALGNMKSPGRVVDKLVRDKMIYLNSINRRNERNSKKEYPITRRIIGGNSMVDVDTCVLCGEPIPEGIQVCPECMRKAGVDETNTTAAEELRDIAAILKITAPTDGNIKIALQGILNIAARLEGKKV